MDDDNAAEVWAQLVSVTDLETTAIPIIKNKFVIGRNNDCDLPHAGNKLVSGRHCYIEKDEAGKVWLFDTSTNGTLLNLSIKLSKGECRELHHGDEIHVVHKKNNTEDDIGYMFQDMEALKAESSSDIEDTQETTQEMDDLDATVPDEDTNAVDTPSPQRKRKSEDASPVANKKLKTDSQSEVPAVKSTGDSAENSSSKNSTETDDKTRTSDKPGETQALPNKVAQEPEEDAIAETLVCIICQELLYDCISLQPCMHSFCAGCYSEWMERSNECPSCRLKVERINKNHIVNNLVEAYLKNKPEKKRPEAELKELDAKNKITRDMLYPVKRPKGIDSDSEDYSDEEDEEDEEENSDPGAGFGNFNFNNNFQGGGLVFGIGTPFFGAVNRPAQPVCRQCPNYQGNQAGTGLGGIIQGAFQTMRNMVTGGGNAGPSTAGATVAGGAGTTTGGNRGDDATAGPSNTADATVADPDAKTFPPAPDFTCRPNGNHVLCLCCMQPMPDRRNQYTQTGTIPPQQCFLCYRSFCHAYWGCHKVDCNGCLAKFKDLNFGKKCLTALILDNAYESEILKNYMEEKGLSVKDVFAECVAKMVTGEYTCTDQARITAQHGINTPICYPCGLRSFKELAYFYRRDIPNDELPKEVTSRSNCYWGKNCRTQRNKPEHAKRFSHICDQTRTA